jgi:hypothetical protein
MRREQFQALGGLALLYPFVCLIMYGLKANTPEKREFLGGEVDMSIQKGFADWLFNHFVSFPLVGLFVVISIVLFYCSSKIRY